MEIEQAVEKSVKKPKLFKLQDFFLKGAYIDAIDTMNKWRVAEIIEVCNSDNTIKIHYEGWSDHWDVWKSFKSSSIATFRK